MIQKAWNGVERRRPQPNDREGRRSGDMHCGQHTVLWDQNEKNRVEYRATTCGKITALNTEINKLENADAEIRRDIIGKSWFRFIMGLVGVGMASLFFQQHWAFKEILTNQREFSSVVHEVKAAQSSANLRDEYFAKAIEDLNKRQDVLRDAHLKQMQK